MDGTNQDFAVTLHVHQIPSWAHPLVLPPWWVLIQSCRSVLVWFILWLANHPRSLFTFLGLSTKKEALLSGSDVCSWHLFSYRIWPKALSLSRSWYMKEQLPDFLYKSTSFPRLLAEIMSDTALSLRFYDSIHSGMPRRKVTDLSLHYLHNQKQQWVNEKVTDIEIKWTKFESPLYYIKSLRFSHLSYVNDNKTWFDNILRLQ